MKTYKITVTDTATYTIASDDKEVAENLALDWFAERKPSVTTEITDDDPDYTIKEV